MALPDDYRQYLLRVSAGGRVRRLSFDGSGWGWDGARYADHAKLHVPFPDHDTALVAAEDLWENEPKREGYASAAAYQADHDAWREAADAAEDARTHGAVFLCDDGCGFYTLLVVSGPMRGTMWFDGRATCDRLSPLLNGRPTGTRPSRWGVRRWRRARTDARQPASFAEWYLDWLAHEEPLATPEQHRAAYRSWHEGTDAPIWFRWFDS